MEGTSMKRALVGLGFFIFFLISYNPVQAGIEWAPGIMESRFWINSQGGYFYYPLTADPYADLWSNDHPTAFNEDTLTELSGHCDPRSQIRRRAAFRRFTGSGLWRHYLFRIRRDGESF